MKNPRMTQLAGSAQSAPDAWQTSETLFLLNCYDVWSATPPRGCACGDPAPAPETTESTHTAIA